MFLGLFFLQLMMVCSIMLQDVDIDSHYRDYSTTTRQSLEAWSGSELNLGLVCAFRNFTILDILFLCWTDGTTCPLLSNQVFFHIFWFVHEEPISFLLEVFHS